jgi:agmatinase
MYERVFFAGPDGFNGDISSSKIVVLPVSYDRTSTWIKGADKGPRAILEASAALELFDIETRTEVYTEGIYTCSELELDIAPNQMAAKVEERVGELIDSGKFVVTLGGEHSVSIGAINAFSKRVKDLSVLQLDAHADLRDSYEGSKFNHACVMARAAEKNKIVQAGIRSMCAGENDKIDPERIFYARDIADSDLWMEKALKGLSENVYITIDLDVFDPSVMPSTGTPEPGGLDWYKITRFLKMAAVRKNIKGFDVVELCPNDYNKAPDFLAAKLIYKLLSYIYSK